MGQGSSVTYSVQPVSRRVPSARAASRMASSSAWAVGVAAALAQVVRAGDGLAALRHHRAHGHLALAEGGLGLLQRQPHQGFMRAHTAAACPADGAQALLT